MANLTQMILNFLSDLPDGNFKFDFYSWSRRNRKDNGYDADQVTRYIRERCKKAMAPVEAKREESNKKALKREHELEKAIIAWSQEDGSIFEGMRVKFKGARDDGYRKVVSFDKGSGQVVGYQFYYMRPWKHPEQETLCDSWSTTQNHVSNIRQVMLGTGEWVKIREYLARNWPHYTGDK